MKKITISFVLVFMLLMSSTSAFAYYSHNELDTAHYSVGQFWALEYGINDFVSFTYLKNNVGVKVLSNADVNTIKAGNASQIGVTQIDVVARVIYGEVASAKYNYTEAIAVAKVIKNRILSSGYPNNAYSVAIQNGQFLAIDNPMFKDVANFNYSYNPNLWVHCVNLARALVENRQMPSMTMIGNRLNFRAVKKGTIVDTKLYKIVNGSPVLCTLNDIGDADLIQSGSNFYYLSVSPVIFNSSNGSSYSATLANGNSFLGSGIHAYYTVDWSNKF